MSLSLSLSLPPSLPSTASSPTDEAGLRTLYLLLARLRAEVARRAAPPVERALDEALRLLMVDPASLPPLPSLLTAPTGSVPANSSSASPSFPPPPPRRPGAAAARAFLQGVATAGRGRGRAGPDPLATEVAAAVAAAKAGKAGPLTDDAAPPPAALPVWDGEAIAPAALAAETAGLVRAAQGQVAELRSAVASVAR